MTIKKALQISPPLNELQHKRLQSGYASKILGNVADRGVTAFMPLAIGVYENKHGQTC